MEPRPGTTTACSIGPPNSAAFSFPRTMTASGRGPGRCVPPRVEDARMARGACPGANLVRFTRHGDDLFQTHIGVEIELGRTERLALEAGRGKPLEHVERGHGSAIGRVDDQVGRGEEDLSRRTESDGSRVGLGAGLSGLFAHGVRREGGPKAREESIPPDATIVRAKRARPVTPAAGGAEG